MRTSVAPRLHVCAAATLLLLSAAGCGHDWDSWSPAEKPGDIAADDDGHSLARCGGTDLLAEAFDVEESVSTAFDYAGSVWITGGEALFPFDTGEYYNSLSSRRFYDLRDNAVSVEVTSVPDIDSGASAFLNIWYNGDNYAQLLEQDGALWFERRIAGASEFLRSIPFDPIAHRFWRLRADDTTLYWETSPDGDEWTSQTSSAAPFSLASVKVQIGGTMSPDRGFPGEARFDNVNGGVRRDGRWCPASTVTDDFDDNITGHGWMRSFFDEAACRHTETGELVFTLLQDQVGQCGYMTASAVDLTEDTLTIKAPLMPEATEPTEVVFAAALDNANQIQFFSKAGALQISKVVGGVTEVLKEVRRDASQHLWWRFRESGGTTSWETSPDRISWSEQAAIDNPFPITALDILLKAGRYEGIGLPDEVRFDQLNLP